MRVLFGRGVDASDDQGRYVNSVSKAKNVRSCKITGEKKRSASANNRSIGKILFKHFDLSVNITRQIIT